MTSAYLPAATVPTSLSIFMCTAGQKVAARMASIGSTPKTRTQVSISRQVESLWKFRGTPLSVPIISTTPDWRSCSNLRAKVGRRLPTYWK